MSFLPIRLQCQVSPKKSAGLVQKVLLSAKANAVNNLGLDEERLRVGECAVQWAAASNYTRRGLLQWGWTKSAYAWVS